jgi:hypothetical protein
MKLVSAVAATALACCASAVAAAADPPVPNWGGNATHFAFSVKATFNDTADAPEHPVWDFAYYYDWSLRAERYEHAEGQHIDVCKAVLIPPGEACTVLAASDGRQYVSSASRGCCLCIANWAPLTVLPDWLSRNNATYLGRSMRDGVLADGWVAMGKNANKYYAAADASQRFVKFSDNKNHREKTWHIRKYSGAQPPAEMFRPPKNCATLCPKTPWGCTGA